MRPPDTYTETPDGHLLIADGMGSVMRWDGSADGLLPVGTTPPAAACVIAADAAVPDPRPAAPATACVLAKDASAAVPPLPATPGAPVVAADHSRDVPLYGGSDPATADPTFPPKAALQAATTAYTAAMRYEDAAGNFSHWSALSTPLNVTRVDHQPFPPNTLALQYTSVPVPTDPTVVRRHVAINANLATDAANNMIGAGDTAGPFHYLDLSTDDISSTTLPSNEAAVRGPTLKTLSKATRVDLAEVAAAKSITGSYKAYYRYLDAQGRISDYSPISNVLPLTAADLAYGFAYTSVDVPPAGVTRRQILRNTAGGNVFHIDIDTDDVTSTSFTSSRTDADLATQPVANDQVPTPGLFGSFWAYVRFVNELGNYSNLSPISNELAVGEGDHVYGVVYSSVPVPTQANVKRRQILRNTSGQAAVFYVDIDTDDLTSTVFHSTKLDGELDDGEAAPLFDAEGKALANRYGVPPGHKCVLATHLGRSFLAVDRVHSDGAVIVTSGSAAVTGVGTEWPAAFAGRQFYVVGGATYHRIASVDVAAQTLTLDVPWPGASDALAGYTIRPAPAERRLVYYTEAGEMESWPLTNALSVQEDSDEITALMQDGSFLWIIERRTIYRFTFQVDPAVDGYVFQSVARGCVNSRCWVPSEGATYMLDEQGVHAFDGSEAKSVSDAVRPLFAGTDHDGPKINWAASDLFHAAVNPEEMVVRFFVCLTGHYSPRHALAYDYSTKRWWVEEYDRPVTASTSGLFTGRRASFYGSAGGRTYLGQAGQLDGVDHTAGRTRGTASRVAGDVYGLTDHAGGWPPGLAGNSVCIVHGRGAGQRRHITGQTETRLALKEPWLIAPDSTSVYQIGGIAWLWASGWVQWSRDEESVPRRLEVIFRTTRSPSALVARVYRDFAGDAVLWEVTAKAADGEGFVSRKGTPDLVAAMDVPRGFAQQRMPGSKELNLVGNRNVSVELSGASSDDPQTIFQVALDGAEA